MATKAEALHVDCGKQPICGCIGFCRGEAHGTGVRTGAQYVEGIRDDGRQVIHNGEIISDVTAHPAFSGAVQSVANIYDMASDPDNAEEMTYESPTTGDRVNRHWSTPAVPGRADAAAQGVDQNSRDDPRPDGA